MLPTAATNTGNTDLAASPFGGGLQPRLFFEGAAHREALARMRFLRANQRLGLVLGEAGLGKSLLLKVFEKECSRQGYAVATVNLIGLSTREFYWQLATQLQATVRPEYDLPRLFRQLADRLTANRLQQIPTVLLMDDIYQAGVDVLAQLTRLVQFDAAGPNPLSLIMTARQSQTTRLGEQLLELVDLRIDLEPWDELDATGYLQLAQVEAGCQQPLFEDEALGEIYRLAEGIPRQVNRLADHALLVGAGMGIGVVDAETVRAAHQALSPPVRE